MGYMTEISFLNDGWHNLRQSIIDDPESFVRKIDVLMNGEPMYGLADETGRREYLGKEFPGDFDDLMRVGNGSTVYPSHHADEPRLYLAYQNMFLSLDCYDLTSEYKGLLDNPNDHLLEVLDRYTKLASGIIRETRKMLKRKRAEQAEAREAGVGS